MGNNLKRKDAKKTIKGSVVLMKKNVLDLNDVNSSVLDRVYEFLGKRVSLQLISAVNGNPVGDYLRGLDYVKTNLVRTVKTAPEGLMHQYRKVICTFWGALITFRR